MVFLKDQMVEDIKDGDDPQSSLNGLVDLNLVSSPMVHNDREVCKKMMVAMLLMKLLL